MINDFGVLGRYASLDFKLRISDISDWKTHRLPVSMRSPVLIPSLRRAAASFKTLDRMTRIAISRVFQCDFPWRAPRH
jgi:hypothetical protein